MRPRRRRRASGRRALPPAAIRNAGRNGVAASVDSVSFSRVQPVERAPRLFEGAVAFNGGAILGARLLAIAARFGDPAELIVRHAERRIQSYRVAERLLRPARLAGCLRE